MIIKNFICFTILLSASFMLSSCVDDTLETELRDRIKKLERDNKKLRQDAREMKDRIAELKKNAGKRGSHDSDPEIVQEVAQTRNPVRKSNSDRLDEKIQTLTSTDGKTIKAEILEVADGEVRIRREDGREFNFDQSRLIKEDQEFLRAWKKANPKKKKRSVKKKVETKEELDDLFNSLFEGR